MTSAAGAVMVSQGPKLAAAAANAQRRRCRHSRNGPSCLPVKLTGRGKRLAFTVGHAMSMTPDASAARRSASAGAKRNSRTIGRHDEAGTANRTQRRAPLAIGSAVTEYKLVVKRVLDNRPSGTCHRLAKALGRNRSLVSQFASPSNAPPVPAQHLEVIFEVCHLSNSEKKEFLAAYLRAHPRRLHLARKTWRTRTISVTVPELNDPDRNAVIDQTIAHMAHLIDVLPFDKGPGAGTRRTEPSTEEDS